MTSIDLNLITDDGWENYELRALIIKDPFSILLVTEDATDEEIKCNYKGLMKRYHPDKSKFAHAEELSQKISQAYSRIKNKESKLAYYGGELKEAWHALCIEYPKSTTVALYGFRGFCLMLVGAVYVYRSISYGYGWISSVFSVLSQ